MSVYDPVTGLWDIKAVCVEVHAQAIIHDGKRYKVPDRWKRKYRENEAVKTELRICE